MKRALSFEVGRQGALVVAGTALIAGTYGLVRLAYGLFLPDIDASLSLGPTLAALVSSGGSLAYCAGALVGLVAPDGTGARAGGASYSQADIREARKELNRIDRQLSKLAQAEDRVHAQMVEKATDHAAVSQLSDALRAIDQLSALFTQIRQECEFPS